MENPNLATGAQMRQRMRGTQWGWRRRTESRARGLGGRPITAVDYRGWPLLTAPMVAHLSGISSSGHSHSVILPLSPVSNGPLDAPPQTGPAIVHSY